MEVGGQRLVTAECSNTSVHAWVWALQYFCGNCSNWYCFSAHTKGLTSVLVEDSGVLHTQPGHAEWQALGPLVFTCCWLADGVVPCVADDPIVTPLLVWPVDICHFS